MDTDGTQISQMDEEAGGAPSSWWRRGLCLLNGPAPLPSRWGIAQSVFFRGIALIYLIAFASWWVQVDGLIGSGGIVPAEEHVAALKQNGVGFWQVPMVFHLGISDAWLHGVCAAGVILSIVVLAGGLPGPLLLVTWFLYLSLMRTGNVFMNFQWDILLQEAGVLAILLAPWRLWVGPRRIFPARASRWIVFLIGVLVFRLMFFSGILKIANDETWRSGVALTYHYETQPVPHALAWFAHQLPGWMQVTSSWIMLIIEIGLPFLLILGRRPRMLAVLAMVGLMLLIMATGNYTYFNLLTILLCLVLLDDSQWPKRIRNWFRESQSDDAQGGWQFPTWIWTGRVVRGLAGTAILILALLTSQSQLIREAGWWTRPLIPGTNQLARVQQVLQPWQVVGGYGLFRVMTTERPEIVIEGSRDGRTWQAYEFRWKPDDRLDRAPRLVAPHQPRMDWQMWFAALNYQYQRTNRTVWFERLMVGVIRGEPEVVALLADNPFPEQPPTYLRARLYHYRYTTPEERRESGNWWKREDLGLYFPIIQRNE